MDSGSSGRSPALPNDVLAFLLVADTPSARLARAWRSLSTSSGGASGSDAVVSLALRSSATRAASTACAVRVRLASRTISAMASRASRTAASMASRERTANSRSRRLRAAAAACDASACA